MKVDIVPVETKSQLKAFIDFPHDLYRSDPNYVPELYISQKEKFDEKKFPFYEYGKVKPFLAYKDGTIVGRICSIDNTNYNSYHNSNVGFFGFFDTFDDFEIARSLFDTAKDWVRTNGRNAMIGPTNFSTNETAGVLVDGFELPPRIMLTYNYPYYGNLYERYGFTKEMDLYAYAIYTKSVSQKSLRVAESLEERLKKNDIHIRKIKKKDFKKETERIKSVYNAAWEKNWGFVPFTDAEFDHLSSELKMLADPKWCHIAEHNSKPVGFAITIPDINEILIDIPRGRLFPFGIFKLLFRKNKYKNVRIVALGVLEEYRRKGIEAIFFAKIIRQAQVQDLISGEASWVLESNQDMVKAAENLNGIRYKTYRLYRYGFER